MNENHRQFGNKDARGDGSTMNPKFPFLNVVVGGAAAVLVMSMGLVMEKKKKKPKFCQIFKIVEFSVTWERIVRNSGAQPHDKTREMYFWGRDQNYLFYSPAMMLVKSSLSVWLWIWIVKYTLPAEEPRVRLWGLCIWHGRPPVIKLWQTLEISPQSPPTAPNVIHPLTETLAH